MKMSLEDRIVLELHEQSEMYGYLLMKALGVASGSLYPVLFRLERRGWIEMVKRHDSSDGPPRTWYRLVGDEARAHAFELAELRDLLQAQDRRRANHGGRVLGSVRRRTAREAPA